MGGFLSEQDYRIFKIVVDNPVHLLILKILCGQWAVFCQNRITGFKDFQDCSG